MHNKLLNYFFVSLFAISFSTNGFSMNAANHAPLPEKKRILSLDPGVLYGYVQILALEEIEKRLGQPISALFDLVGGTSTGALLAALLTHGEPGKPTYSAKEIRGFYELFGPEIFSEKSVTLPQVVSAKTLQEKGSEFLTMAMWTIATHIDYLRPCNTEGDYKRADVESLKSAFEKGGVEGLKEEIKAILTPFDVSTIVREGQSPESFKNNLVEEFAGKLSEPLNILNGKSPLYFDYSKYQELLALKLGDKKISQSIKPIAIFSILSNASKEDTLLGAFVYEGPSERERAVFSTVHGKAQTNKDLKLVDAVYASSAAFNLFPPAEIEYDGATRVFIDGDNPDFRTMDATIKVARELWPDAFLEVFALGYERVPFARSTSIAADITGLPKYSMTSVYQEFIDERRIVGVEGMITYNMQAVQYCDEEVSATSANGDNFSCMERHAQDLVQGKYFSYIIDRLKADSQ